MISNNKISEDLYNLVRDLNNQAYKYTYDLWSEADTTDGEESENIREDASTIQCGLFRKFFDQLDNITKNTIFDYTKTDKDFSQDFEGWYDKNLILIPTLDDNALNALDLSIDPRKNKWFANWLKNQDTSHSYLSKYQIEWIINETEAYIEEMSQALKNNEIEKSDLENAKEYSKVIKKFFSSLV